MRHLEFAFVGRNAFWRYIVLIAAAFIAANTVGAIPLIISSTKAILADPEAASRIAENPMDVSMLVPNSYYGLFSMLFPFVIGIVAFALLVRPMNERSFKMTITGASKIRWKHFFYGFFVWIVLSALYLLLYYKIEPSNFVINNTTISLVFVSLIALALIPFQAGFEEVIFRGYLMQGFARMLGYRWFPLIMTSLLFGLMHAFNPEVQEYGFFTMMPQYIVFGLIFGIATVLDDGIEVALGAHTANNIFLIIMVTHRSSALQSPALLEQQSVYPWTEFTGLLISGVLFLLIMKMMLRWKDLSFVVSRIDKTVAENPTINQTL